MLNAKVGRRRPTPDRSSDGVEFVMRSFVQTGILIRVKWAAAERLKGTITRSKKRECGDVGFQ
jgi:hypothetical protein